MNIDNNFENESSIVDELGRRGVILSTEDGKLNYNSQRAPLSQGDRDTLVAHKAGIISYLEYLNGRCRAYIDRYETRGGEARATFQQDGYRKFYAGGDLSKVKPNIFSRILSVRPLSKGADEAILEKAIDQVCANAATLRAELFVEGDRTYQHVSSYQPFKLSRLKLDDLAASGPLLDDILSGIAAKSAYPLFNAAIVSNRDGARCLVMLVSHLVFDLWSKNLLESRVEQAYRALAGGADQDLGPDAVQYNDYAEEQKDFDLILRDMKYWSHNLSGARTPDLPMSHADKSPGTFSYADFSFGGRAAARLTEISKGQGTTLSVGMLSLFAAALRIWSGDDDLVINTTYNGRNHEKYYRTIGLFAGRVPVRLKIKDDDSLLEIIDDAVEAQTSAWSYSLIPTKGISEVLELPAGINKIVFNSSIEMGGSDEAENGGPSPFLESADPESNRLSHAVQAAHFRAPRMEPTDIELIFYVSRSADGIAVKIGYSNRFDRRDIDNLIKIFETKTKIITANARATIRELAGA